MTCIKEHKRNKKVYSVILEANNFKSEFQVDEEVEVNRNTITAAAKKIKRKQKLMQCTKFRNDGKIRLFSFNTLLKKKKMKQTPYPSVVT